MEGQSVNTLEGKIFLKEKKDWPVEIVLHTQSDHSSDLTVISGLNWLILVLLIENYQLKQFYPTWNFL